MTFLFRTFAVVAFPAVLAGCGTQERVIEAPVTARAETPQWFDQAAPEDVDAYFERKCLDYGFESQTPQLSSCVEVTEGAARSLARFALEE